MEYEIDDDPQGLCDVSEADRTGGVKEDRILHRRRDERPCEAEPMLQPE